LTEKQQKSRYQGFLKSMESSRGQNRENWNSKSKRKKKNRKQEEKEKIKEKI